jgi:hypothetical protein
MMTRVMMRQSATDQEIQNWVESRHGFRPETYWIAHCKDLCGLTHAPSGTRQSWQRCPADKQIAIKQAFKHFGMLPTDY